MGRPPVGKTAMTGAERQRRYWLKRQADKPVTKPATKPVGTDHAALARARARVAELEQQVKAGADEIAALKRQAKASVDESAMLRGRLAELANRKQRKAASLSTDDPQGPGTPAPQDQPHEREPETQERNQVVRRPVQNNQTNENHAE